MSSLQIFQPLSQRQTSPSSLGMNTWLDATFGPRIGEEQVRAIQHRDVTRLLYSTGLIIPVFRIMSVQQFTGTRSLNYRPSGSLSADFSPQTGLLTTILALFQNTVRQTRLSSAPPPAKLLGKASMAVFAATIAYSIYEEYQFGVLPIFKEDLRLVKTVLCCGTV